MAIPLIDKEDVLSHSKKEKYENRSNRSKRVIIKKEKPIRVIRIKFYEKISLPHMREGKMEYLDAFAIDRSLEDLLKAFHCSASIQGMITPPGCIFVEKDYRMGNNNKFIFLELNISEFGILKKEMENYRTIQGYNKGEFIIMEGGRKSLSETFDMPRIVKYGTEDLKDFEISDKNKIIARENLRQELKDKFSHYHSYNSERIDNMSEKELIELKKLVNEKIKIENRKRKVLKEFLER